MSPMIATRRGRKEGRHAKLSVSEDIDEMDMMTSAENGIESYDCRDTRGALPDTIPMLTSTAVHVDEPMKSYVTSIEIVWESCVVIM